MLPLLPLLYGSDREFSRKTGRDLNHVSGWMKAENGAGLSERTPSQRVRHSLHNCIRLCTADKILSVVKGRDDKYALF